MSVSEIGNVLVYSQGKNVQVVDLSVKGKAEEKSNQFAIKREAQVTALTLNRDGSVLAIGDKVGKIYVAHGIASMNKKLVI
jgi:hypothetical protein